MRSLSLTIENSQQWLAVNSRAKLCFSSGIHLFSFFCAGFIGKPAASGSPHPAQPSLRDGLKPSESGAGEVWGSDLFICNINQIF